MPPRKVATVHERARQKLGGGVSFFCKRPAIRPQWQSCRLRRQRRGVVRSIRDHRHNDRVFLYAFDLIELNGDDMPTSPEKMDRANKLARLPFNPRWSEN
jgi:hypothetical protein